MDANNIAWHLTDGASGYPCGSFFQAALNLALPRGDASDTFALADELVNLYVRADLIHLRQLVDGLGVGVNVAVSEFLSGHRDPSRLVVELGNTLPLLPALLPAALPELLAAMRAFQWMRAEEPAGEDPDGLMFSAEPEDESADADDLTPRAL